MEQQMRDLATELANLVSATSQIRGTELRLRTAHELHELLAIASRAALKERRNAMIQLHHGDMRRLDEIADICGISRQRVEQILNIPKRNRPPRVDTAERVGRPT